MKIPSFMPIVILAASCAPLLVGAREGCIDSFAELDYFESLVTDYSKVRRYILCDRTFFDAGALHPFYGTVLPTTSMLHLRPNLHIQCGNSGTRQNHCRVRYGDIQVDGTNFYGVHSDSLDNVLIQGVTFIGSRKHSVFVNKPGDILFQDCEFKNHTKAQLPVKLDYFDDESTAMLSVRFRGCTFAHNQFSGFPAQPALVVATSSQNRITLADCVFNNNNMLVNTGDASQNSVLVESAGPLELNRNCFEDNRVGSAAITVYSASIAAANNYQQGSSGKVCPGRSFSTSEPTCLTFDSTACVAGDPYSPTGSPTIPPTSIPTSAPSPKPTRRPTHLPTGSPTSRAPTRAPSGKPTSVPTGSPTGDPTATLSTSPTHLPSLSPSGMPSFDPTQSPTTLKPTNEPTTANPTLSNPTSSPSDFPSESPFSVVDRLALESKSRAHHFSFSFLLVAYFVAQL